MVGGSNPCGYILVGHLVSCTGSVGYEIDKTSYNKLLRDNVTANYEKTDSDTLNSINLEEKRITQKT